MDIVTTATALENRRRHSSHGATRSASTSPSGVSGGADAALRIAMLAPPWISTPSPGYGGVESVVSTLTEALVRRGHDVTLFAAPGSRSQAAVVTLLDRSHPDEIERSLYEVDHVAQAFDRVGRGASAGCAFDVIHDHCGFAGLAFANLIDTPLVHTLHGPFTAETTAFYVRHGHKGTLVGISQAQLNSVPPGLQALGPIANPIDVQDWPSGERKGDYLLWIGRMTPEKGPQRAIAAARAVDVPLVLAGVIQPGQQEFFDREVAPLVDGDRVRFIGEVGGSAKRSLFARARGLLMPIRWDEPFGMVIVEALACGTPVIAFPEGAVPELIVHEKTGFLVNDVREMSEAICALPRIRSSDCQTWVREHCDGEVVAEAYERVYRSVMSRNPLAEIAAVAASDRQLPDGDLSVADLPAVALLDTKTVLAGV
jgi:glycosyltransferase involved in cell wall biosynthesis